MSIHHPIFARLYPKMAKAMERGGMADHRRALLAGLTGTVIEVGAGDGLNFRHYPPTVTRVLAVEPEPHLRGLAQANAAKAPVQVEVVDGLAEQLPAETGSMDAVVVSLVLCSVRDQNAALQEFQRVLKSGGQLRFLEHVRANTRGLARVQRVLDATLWPCMAGGCHVGRDTVRAIEQSGFSIDRCAEFQFPNVRTPSSFHILGTAVRAGNDQH
jgi:ubiquinone/menaquinone biosynthesis C-methylase UbiE